MEGLKEFLLKALSAHNCEADSDVLADYIIALVENGVKDNAEFTEHLQAFLYDSTDSFVKGLIEFLNDSKPKDTEAFEEEIEVDYEESSEESMSISVPQIQRPLREYSPERRAAVVEKRPCTNFVKYGNCRFGDNCRFAHTNSNMNSARRRHVSTSVKLSNLPVSVLNPTALIDVMSKYGNVINVTVYPEKGEALVQFALGEEALKAVEGAVNDFESEGVVVELEMAKQPGRTTTHSQSTKSDDSTQLKFLLNLQTQQQSLLEANLSTQTSLLTSLQNAPSEELMGTLKKVQESGKGLEEMLKRTGELIDKIIKGESKEIINKKRPFNQPPQQQYNYHKQTKPQYQARPNVNKWPLQQSSTPYNNTYRPNNNSSTSTYTVRPNSLDLRPTTLKLSPLPATNLTDIHALQRQFSPFGPLQSLIITEAGRSAVIKYQKHADAMKAFERVGKEFEGVEGIEFEFVKQ